MSDELAERVARLWANVRTKTRLSEADLAQAASIHVDAHRAGREDVKAEVRAILDADE